MKVQCKYSRLNDIPDIAIRKRLCDSIHGDGPDSHLTVAEIYAVVALSRWDDGGFRVYLHTVRESDYPFPYPLEMFDVVDAYVSEDWVMSFAYKSGRVELKTISFPEWVADERFYEKLTDGEDRAIRSYRQRILRLE